MRELRLIDKLNHIKNLILVGKSDGFLTQDEIHLITQIAKKHKLSLAEISYTLQQKDEIPFTMPASFTERLVMLYDLVSLMVVDFFIHDEEKKLCVQLAKKFEFNPQIVDELIEDILSQILEGKDCDEAISYLVKYAQPLYKLN